MTIHFFWLVMGMITKLDSPPLAPMSNMHVTHEVILKIFTKRLWIQSHYNIQPHILEVYTIRDEIAQEYTHARGVHCTKLVRTHVSAQEGY
jgi:hypothetical protein